MSNDPAEKAHDFREGYVQGAHAVIKAIGDDLPENQVRVLEKWIAGPLAEWVGASPDDSPPPLPMIDGA